MLRRIAFSAAFICVVAGHQASAQTSPDNGSAETLPMLEQQADSGANVPAAVTYLENQGVKLTYLGGDGGVRSYLAVDPKGQFQTFYVMPDGVHFIAGVMFGESGQDTTGAQISQMKDRYNQITSGQTPTPASEPSAPLMDESTPSLPAPQAPSAQSTNPDPTASTDELATSQTNAGSPPEQTPQTHINGSELTLPGSKTSATFSSLTESAFENDLNHAFYFTVGYPNAPAVYMVADPQCEFCHAAWALIKPLVLSGKVKLNVIMINGLPGSENYALAIMAENNPGQAWYDGQGSTPGVQLIPAPPAVGSATYEKVEAWLQDNDDFAQTIGMTATPFLAYVGRAGTFHATQAPDDVLGFLSDLPAPAIGTN